MGEQEELRFDAEGEDDAPTEHPVLAAIRRAPVDPNGLNEEEEAMLGEIGSGAAVPHSDIEAWLESKRIEMLAEPIQESEVAEWCVRWLAWMLAACAAERADGALMARAVARSRELLGLGNA